MNITPVATSMSRWSGLAGMARIVWDDLTIDELLSSEGDSHKLTEMVQERYNTTHYEANRQVTNFFRTALSYLA
jgi:uncharacterized protein YjbJ (UPF0337 family)